MSYPGGGRWAGGTRPRLPETLDRSGDACMIWDTVDASIREDRGLLICGEVGVGKTTTMAYIERQIAKLRPTPSHSTRSRAQWLENSTWWICCTEYIADVRLGWDMARSSSRSTDWGPHCDAKGIAAVGARLFLDDLGTELPTPSSANEINELVDARYSRGLPLWVTTNLTPTDILARYGQRTMSRLIEMCGLLYIPGQDRRRGWI